MKLKKIIALAMTAVMTASMVACGSKKEEAQTEKTTLRVGVMGSIDAVPLVIAEQNGYFEEEGKDGFAYAYQYPGMNKVLQAAGRVIRTASDQGVILLLDDRFWRREYRELFPREWSDVKRVSLSSLEQELQAFWSRFPEVQ